MGLFETLGWSRPKARPVGDKLETDRSEEAPATSQHWGLKAVLFVVLLAGTLLAFPRGDRYEYTVQSGDAWQRQRLVAPFNFPVFKNPDSLEAERQRVRRNTRPFFRQVADAEKQVAAHRDSVRDQLDHIFEAYASYRRNEMRGRFEEAAEDSLRYRRLRRNAQLTLSPDQWNALTSAYTERLAGLSTPSRELPTGPRLDEQALGAADSAARDLLQLGVMNVPRSEVPTDEIIVRDQAERVDRARPAGRLYGLNEAYNYAQNQFRTRFSEDSTRAQIAQSFFRAIFTPSLEYLRDETIRARKQKEERISPTRGVVQRGEIIVRQGQQIDELTKRKLTSLEQELTQRAGPKILWHQLGGEFLLVLATYLIFFAYLFFLRRPIFDENRLLLIISLLFAGIIAFFGVVVRVPSVSLYAVPVGVAAVQLTIMFDSRIGLWGTLTLALIGGLILGFDLEFTLATLFAGTLGVFSVRDIKNRGQYFLSGGLVFIGYALTLVAGWLYFGTPTGRLYTDLGYVGANALFVVLAYPLLWVFERSFDITTDLTLLELSDTNRPLLKELSLRAPGTFNHTLQVANLAEAGADAVGANALLARVGALYHDIGKMLMPTYYVENQRTGDNPHDRLKPRMSALIIASHVKEGLEMGREHGLPQRVLEFVPMHHGTTRIEYFYRRALDQTDEHDPDVLESEFRYPGPHPHSRETAILMLADGVEAASRSLEDPTRNKLETLIDDIFRARADDGQLNDTDLTFRDLNTIKDTFLSMLSGIYHVRVKYPDQEEQDEAEQAERTASEEEEAAAAQKMPETLPEGGRNTAGQQDRDADDEDGSEEDGSEEDGSEKDPAQSEASPREDSQGSDLWEASEQDVRRYRNGENASGAQQGEETAGTSDEGSPTNGPAEADAPPETPSAEERPAEEPRNSYDDS
jgi:putative nucleotidyltransferase with HDIG domain